MNVIDLPNNKDTGAPLSDFDRAMIRLSRVHDHLPAGGKRLATTGVQLLTEWASWLWGLQ